MPVFSLDSLSMLSAVVEQCHRKFILICPQSPPHAYKSLPNPYTSSSNQSLVTAKAVYYCPVYDKAFTRLDNQQRHTRTCPCRKRKCESSSGYTCRHCGASRADLRQHVEEIPQGDPKRTLAGDDPELQQEFRVNRAHIYRGHSFDSNPAIYNFPTGDLNGVLDEINDGIYSVF